jgi:chemotaxis protein methyltransferase CheR
MASLPLSPQVFAILSGLVEERAGLHYRPDDLDLLRDKVSLRAEQAGFGSLLDYYYFLRYDAAGSAELDTLVEALVVHETYFFREADQLRVLCQSLLQPALAGPGPVRIWCAACATGEEPFTLAMLLDEVGLLQRARIVATDVSARALERARRGQFGARSMRALPAGVEGRWLRREGGSIKVEPRLAESIEWRQLNLIDGAAVAAMGLFHAVLARNVLIYFSDDTVRRVVAQLADALIPGGLLLVGASESLLRYGTVLSCEEHGGAFFYRRKAS